MRALILGPPDVSRGALTAVRSLGRAGWEVGYGCPRRDGLVTRSRWLKRWHVVPWPQHGLDAFDRALHDALEQGHYEAVFAAADDWLVALDAVRRRIPAVVPYAPSSGLLASLDKLELGDLARRAGLQAPKTEIATTETLARWQWPAVIKPRSHWVQGAQDPPVRLATTFAPDRATATERAAELQAHGSTALLQERLSGPLLALTTLINEASRPVATVQQAADRVWPSPAGVSTRAVTVKVDPALAAGVQEMLHSLHWVGLAQAQFLLTGSGPVLIDLNPRYYGSMALALRAGVDWPVLWARLATGRPVPGRSDPVLGARYSWLEGVLLFARGGDILDLLYGEEFVNRGAPIVIWLAIAPLFAALGYLSSNSLFVRGRDLRPVIASAIALAANLALNFTLIPRLGGTGAAVATTISYVIQAGIAYTFLWRWVGRIISVAGVGVPLSSCALVAAVLLLPWHILLVAPLSAMTYVAAWYLLSRRFDPEQVDLLHGVLPGRGQR